MSDILWLMGAPVPAKFGPLTTGEKVRQLRIAAMRARHEADALVQMPVAGPARDARVARLREQAHKMDVMADRLMRSPDSSPAKPLKTKEILAPVRK